MRFSLICLLSASLGGLVQALPAPVEQAPRSWEFRPAAEAWQVRILGESDAGLELELRLNELQAIPEEDGWRCLVGGLDNLETPGQPALPFYSELLALPAQAGVGLEILHQESEVLELGHLPPSPEWESDYLEAQPAETAFDPSIYGQEAFWPAQPARLGEPALWHGLRVAPLDVFPLSWEPAEGQLRVTTLLRLRVSFQGEDYRNTREPERPLSSLARELVLPAVANPRTAEAQASRLDPQDEVNLGRYFVIYPESAQTYLDPWIAWKREMGYRVRTLTREAIGSNVDYNDVKAHVDLEYAAEGIDYLVLVGDMDSNPGLYYMPSDLAASGQHAEHGTWGWNIVSDHSYSLQEGSDYFPDLLVGRLSVDSHQQLNTLVTKQITYAKEPTDPGAANWYNNAGLVYDIAQAGSRRETMYSLSHLLEDRDYDQFTFIENDLWGNPLSPAVVTNMVNQGASVVSYRGYGYRYQWAGPYFGVTHIFNDLTNFQAWPFVTSIVCGGGDFGSADSDPCFGEAWLRASNGPSPKGAIGFIGPSELDTHTKWNNCITMGIYQGLVHDNVSQLGALMNRGKHELWMNFPNDRIEDWSPGGAGNNVPHYFYSYNLLGDPGLRLRTSEPVDLVVDVDSELATGNRQVQVHVEAADNGAAIPDAVVYVYDPVTQSGELARTDEAGSAWLDLGELQAGELVLTVHGRELRPSQGVIQVSQQASAPALSGWAIADEDGLAMPGESFSLELEITETGSEGLDLERSLYLVSHNPLLVVEQDVATLPATSAGESQLVGGDFSLQLSGYALDGAECPLDLFLEEQWLGRFLVRVRAPSWRVLDQELLSGAFEPGEEAEFRLELALNDLQDMDALDARLLVDHGGVTLLQPNADVPAMTSGAQASSTAFSLVFDEDMLPGTLIDCWIQFEEQGQVIAETPFTLQLGEAGPGDPMGPDAEGYVIFHSSDSDYEQAPLHVFQDIQEAGTPIDLVDTQDSQWNGGVDGVSAVVELPFVFTFYGQPWVEATVCSNGWLAMGAREDYYSARNVTIPGAQGPPGMISPYWTDLINSNGWDTYGSVHTWHDAQQNQFVIQWSGFRHGTNQGDETFQVILRDPAHWPTPSGNGEILFVYDDISPTIGDGSITVGIETYDHTSGLQYLFSNDYCDACQPIGDDVTLLITDAPDFESTSVGESATQTADFRLAGIAPNPFNPSTRVRFELGQARSMAWTLYDIRGARVAGRSLGDLAPGSHAFRLDGSALASGVYMLQLGSASGEVLATEKLLLLK